MTIIYFIVAVLSVLVTPGEAYKVLGLFPHPGNSHQAVFEPLLQDLVDNGHSLKVISHFPPRREHPLYRWINMGIFENLHKEVWDLNLFDLNYFGLENYLYYRDTLILTDMGNTMCDALTKLPEVQKMVIEKEKFDVALVENFNSDCAVGLAYLLDVPVIAMQSHIAMPWTFSRFRQPSNPSYIPCIFLMNGPHMTFLGRLENTISHYLLSIIYNLKSQVPDRQIIERNLNRTIPPLEEIAKKTVGLISNTHYTLNGIKPLLPGIVECGGMHLKKQLSPIEPELEKYLNESTNGVILFTLGSMIKVSTLKPEKIDAFIKTFAELKQNVIWKWEGDPIENLPSNVVLKKWVPQYEILHHPNTVAFISHGGLLGTTEAVKIGMPVLFVPVFADQYANSAAAVEAGLGVQVRLRSISKEAISEGIKKVLSPEIKISAKELSAQWNDRPSPLATATKTVEYVAKYKGKRLISPAVDLKTYELLLLDVILFSVFILVCFVSTIYFICKTIFKKLRSLTSHKRKVE